MPCYDLRLCLYDIWELPFQGSGDSAMQLLAAAAQQGAVGGFLH